MCDLFDSEDFEEDFFDQEEEYGIDEHINPLLLNSEGGFNIEDGLIFGSMILGNAHETAVQDKRFLQKRKKQ